MRNVITTAAVLLAFVTSQSSAQTASLKDGWSEAQLSSLVAGCVQGIVTPAKRDFEAAAAADPGKPGKEFPEQALRASAGAMCTCLSHRIANTWTFGEFMKNPLTYTKPLIAEAMAGGQCKPEGLLAEMRNRGRAK